MNNIKLEKSLKELNVSIHEYSLNGELKSEAIILFKNHSIWEVFYFDEKGKRNNEMKFDTESQACDYIFKQFLEAKKIKEKYNIK